MPDKNEFESLASPSSGNDWRLLVESVEEYAIYMLDPVGIVTTWNSGAQRIKGFTANEIVGKPFSLFFCAEDVREGKPQRELELAKTYGRYAEEGLRVRKDGSTFWASVIVTPVRDGTGTLLGFAKVTRDLTERKHAERTTRELALEQSARATAEAAEARVRESEERYRTLSQRLQSILEGVADGITVQERSGRIIFANSAAARASGFESVTAFLAAAPEEIVGRFEILDEAGAPVSHDLFPGRRVLRGEPSNALLMRVRERVTGQESWSQVRATGIVGADGQTDLAINIFHDVSQDRRREHQERCLAQATASLAQSLDSTTMLPTLATVLVPALADWCSVHLLTKGGLETVAVAHVDPDKVRFARELGEKYPAKSDLPHGVWQVIKTATGELYEDIPEALLEQAAHDAEHLAMLRALGMKSALIVPIRARGQVLGCMSLITSEGSRRYDVSDLSLATELGQRAGTAIDNARLYAAESKARADLTLLAQAGEAFSASASYEEMLQSVVSIALPALADFAFFDVVEGSDVRRIAAAYQDSTVEALIQATKWERSERKDKNLCALSSGESGCHPAIDDAWLVDVAAGPEHLALLRKLSLTSMLTVPLRAQGNVIGSLTLCFGKSLRHHTPEDQKLAEELARRAAIAVIQVRLYAQAQHAAKRAEEANRVKDEFLATVSHELRTPLNAMLGWASLLRSRSLDAPVAKGVEVIHRNAVAQAKIIEDILDVSRIITGKLRLDLKAANLVSIVRDAIEVIAPASAAKGLTVEFIRPPEDCMLIADAERLQQVVWNLLSNAVKFSHRSGRIDVRLEQQGPSLQLSVTDTGQGIEPEFLPFVFDRFKQADGSMTRRVGGLGLGLAIVRHLVDLHGGKVEAASDGQGKGASFIVTLPIRALPAASASPSGSQATPALADAARPDAALAGVRVLVVDDESDARELVRAVLVGAGAVVETAASAADGLHRLQRFLPHVLVSDIGMPGEDGYTFMQRVKSLDPALGGGIPSLALTAYAREQDKTKAFAMGFTTHLGKPFNPPELVSAVGHLATAATR